MAPPRSIHREHLLNKLRALGFRFKKQSERVDLFHRPTDGCRVEVRRKDLLDEQACRIILRQAGCAAAEVNEFCGAARAN